MATLQDVVAPLRWVFTALGTHRGPVKETSNIPDGIWKWAGFAYGLVHMAMDMFIFCIFCVAKFSKTIESKDFFEEYNCFLHLVILICFIVTMNVLNLLHRNPLLKPETLSRRLGNIDAILAKYNAYIITCNRYKAIVGWIVMYMAFLLIFEIFSRHLPGSIYAISIGLLHKNHIIFSVFFIKWNFLGSCTMLWITIQLIEVHVRFKRLNGDLLENVIETAAGIPSFRLRTLLKNVQKIHTELCEALFEIESSFQFHIMIYLCGGYLTFIDTLRAIFNCNITMTECLFLALFRLFGLSMGVSIIMFSEMCTEEGRKTAINLCKLASRIKNLADVKQIKFCIWQLDNKPQYLTLYNSLRLNLRLIFAIFGSCISTLLILVQFHYFV